MNSRTLIASAVLSLLAVPALAGGAHDAKPMTTHQLNVASARAAASASARGGSAKATGGSVNNSVDGRGYGYAPPGLALAGGGTCAGVSSSVSGGGALISLGFGRGEIDDDCTLRNNIAVVDRYDPLVAAEMVKDLSGYKDAAKRLGR